MKPWTPPKLPDAERSIADLIREIALLKAQDGVDAVIFDENESNRRRRAAWARIAAIWDELAARHVLTDEDASGLIELVRDRIDDDNDSDSPDPASAILGGVLQWLVAKDRPDLIAYFAKEDRERAGLAEAAS